MRSKINLLSNAWSDYKDQMAKAHPDAVLSKIRFVKHGFLNSYVFESNYGIILYQKLDVLGVECVVPSHFAPKNFKAQKRLVEEFSASFNYKVILAVTPQLSKMAGRLGFLSISKTKAMFADEEIDKEILIHKGLMESLMIPLCGLGLFQIGVVLFEISQDFNTTLNGGDVESEYLQSNLYLPSSEELWYFFRVFQPDFYGRNTEELLTNKVFDYLLDNEYDYSEFDSEELEEASLEVEKYLHYEEKFNF